MRRWILVVVLGAGCVRGAAGTRCERLCRAEAECAEKLELLDNDFVGCMESCTELARDPKTAKLVDEHMKCVAAAAGSCSAAMECR